MPDFERVLDKLAVDIQPNEVEKQKILAYQKGKNFARWQIVKVVGFFLLGYVLLTCLGCKKEKTDIDGTTLNMNVSTSFVYTQWNRHRYIVNKQPYIGGIEHDPDCPSCSKK